MYQTGTDFASMDDAVSVVLLIPRAAWFGQNMVQALSSVAYPFNWRQAGEYEPNEAAELGASMMTTMTIGGMVGQIVPYIGNVAALPEWLMICDGSTFLRVDYPALYETINNFYRVDADTGRTPDLRGRGVIGSGTGGGLTPRTFGEELGEETHTLTTGEMPSHTHTEGNATTSTAAPPVPPAIIPSAVATVGVTGSAGGGGAHNNMQPSTALFYVIWCK